MAAERNRVSQRSSSASKTDAPRRSHSLDKSRSRCQSVPTPPPRSRKNINHFHKSILDSSLADEIPEEYPALRQNTPSVATAKIVANANFSVVHSMSNQLHGRPNSAVGSEARYHQRVITHNTINYNLHFNRAANNPPVPENDATVIDCTFATPVMTQIPDNWPRPRRSHSASRLQIDSCLSIAPPMSSDDASLMNSKQHQTLPKTITWIEKTWSTTGCQTILSCTPKPMPKEDPYSKSIRELTPPRERPSRRKVNFADEPQFEEQNPLFVDDKMPPRMNTPSPSPPTVPPPPESDSSESPSPPPLPTVPPPPLTPPSTRSHKRVTLNDEVSVEPPPVPNTSPPPLTPEPFKIIKPCIKYPKSFRSLSAPSSPAMRKVKLSTPLVRFPDDNANLNFDVPERYQAPDTPTTAPPVPPPPAGDEIESGDFQCTNRNRDDKSSHHSPGNCERNCKNCFYI